MFLKLQVILKGHLHKEKHIQIAWYQINKERGRGMWGAGGGAAAWLGVAVGPILFHIIAPTGPTFLKIFFHSPPFTSCPVV